MADQRFETSGTEERSTQRVRRLRSALPTVIFDVVGPLIIYYGLKSAGYSNVSALVVSGVLPRKNSAL